jgi:hypothetical protein
MSIPSYSGCNQNNYSLSGNKSQTFSPGSSGTMVFAMAFGCQVAAASPFNLAHTSSMAAVFRSRNSSIVAAASPSSTRAATEALRDNLDQRRLDREPDCADRGTVGWSCIQTATAPKAAPTATGGDTNINGALYFSNQNVTFNGGTSTGGAICTQLVALTITFNGNAAFNNNCLGKGVRGIGTSFVKLVE